MASLKNRTFTNLADLNDGVLGDDYVHGALETWKVKGKTSNGGKWDYKAKIKHSQKDGQLSGTLSDELKIQFPYDKYYFWFGTRRNGDLKIHADLGNVTVAGQEFNLFTNLKTSINFKNFAFRFGANHFNGNLTTSTRIVTNTNNSQHVSTSLTNRTFLKQGNLFYGLVTSFGLSGGFAVQQYDAIVGFEKDKLNVYAQHTSGKEAGLKLGTVTGTVTYSQDQQQYGVEVSNNFQKNALSATLGASTKVGDATVRAKINNNLDLQFGWKKAINNQLTVAASGSLALTKGAKAVDFSQYVPIPFGVQFEVNV